MNYLLQTAQAETGSRGTSKNFVGEQKKQLSSEKD